MAQLEPASVQGTDFFDRFYSDHPHSVHVDGDTEEWTSYEIEKLMGRRYRRYGTGKRVKEYLVRWKGYGAKFDEWYGENLLDDSSDLVMKYELEHSLSTGNRHDEVSTSHPISRDLGRFLGVFIWFLLILCDRIERPRSGSCLYPWYVPIAIRIPIAWLNEGAEIQRRGDLLRMVKGSTESTENDRSTA